MHRARQLCSTPPASFPSAVHCRPIQRVDRPPVGALATPIVSITCALLSVATGVNTIISIFGRSDSCSRNSPQLLCFQTLPHSFATLKMLSPVFSVRSALFAQKHRGVGGTSFKLKGFNPLRPSVVSSSSYVHPASPACPARSRREQRRTERRNLQLPARGKNENCSSFDFQLSTSSFSVFTEHGSRITACYATRTRLLYFCPFSFIIPRHRGSIRIPIIVRGGLSV